jgi:hypothetical protein
MGMTKFEDVEDPGFVAVTGELRRWIKNISRSENIRQPQLEGESLYRPIRDEETQGSYERRVLAITQGSHFHGPTTVSGGSLFQGNFVGRDTPF